ncbi:cupin domain-containing protein [uncultured Paraglaciecola sp.]|uniref:cupin domain-containing protein n=1 Tax=uncultured Paraglaciecola sp. TaxID=1765024 RepID=UPI0025DF3B32|nr:cupin domain-containing protein [uncultured Paraglaciecola sp.]
MKIAADFTKREIVHSANMPWLDSPMAGVARRPLDRVGEEVARATTVVRYAPGSQFSPHVHTGGEEFVVLEGVFQDEHGDYPVGSYVRNPPQSSHTPGSEAGCVILVKLWQFQPEDRTPVRLNIRELAAVTKPDDTGVSVVPLFKDKHEQVSVIQMKPNTNLELSPEGGAELFVLQGSVKEQQDSLIKHSWLRAPIGYSVCLNTDELGAEIWLKTGHLTDVDQQIRRVLETR